MILAEFTTTEAPGATWGDDSNSMFADDSNTMFADTEDVDGTYYFSMDGLALDVYYDAKIVSMKPIQIAPKKDYGGYAKLNFGSISFQPDFLGFKAPATARITLKIYNTTTELKELIVEGVAHRTSISRKSITYEIYRDDYADETAATEVINDTLEDVVTWACGAGKLNLSTDFTAGRVVSPAVLHTTTSDQLTIDLLSDICAFFNHGFYITDGTLYLVDYQIDNGSRTLTEFDFFPSDYESLVPVSEVKSGDVITFSEYTYGDSVTQTAYHTTSGNVVTAQTDILSTLNTVGCRLRMPLKGGIPVFGEKITWPESSIEYFSAAWIRARVVTLDFVRGEMVIEGEGGIS